MQSLLLHAALYEEFRELIYHWLIYVLFISESQDSSAQSMAIYKKTNRNVVEKYTWQFMTTRSTILY